MSERSQGNYQMIQTISKRQKVSVLQKGIESCQINQTRHPVLSRSSFTSGTNGLCILFWGVRAESHTIMCLINSKWCNNIVALGKTARPHADTLILRSAFPGSIWTWAKRSLYSSWVELYHLTLWEKNSTLCLQFLSYHVAHC